MNGTPDDFEHRLEPAVALAHTLLGARALDEHRRLARADVGDADLALAWAAAGRAKCTVSAPSTSPSRLISGVACTGAHAFAAREVSRNSGIARRVSMSSMTTRDRSTHARPQAPSCARVRAVPRARAVRSRCWPRRSAGRRAAIDSGDESARRAVHARERRQDELQLIRQFRDGRRASRDSSCSSCRSTDLAARQSSGSSRRP